VSSRAKRTVRGTVVGEVAVPEAAAGPAGRSAAAGPAGRSPCGTKVQQQLASRPLHRQTEPNLARTRRDAVRALAVAAMGTVVAMPTPTRASTQSEIELPFEVQVVTVGVRAGVRAGVGVGAGVGVTMAMKITVAVAVAAAAVAAAAAVVDDGGLRERGKRRQKEQCARSPRCSRERHVRFGCCGGVPRPRLVLAWPACWSGCTRTRGRQLQ
jgi:hypothetical protein